MKILIVCTGNICRSPMAEVLLRHRLEERGCSGVEVVSAGTWAGAGGAATDGAVAALAAMGIDLGAHRSRPLTARDVEAADLVVAMTSVHRREILAVAPGADRKIVLMKELAEMERGHDGAQDVAARVEGLLAGTRPPWRRSLDLDDPYGLPSQAYERTLREIDAGVTALVEILCGHG